MRQLLPSLACKLMGRHRRWQPDRAAKSTLEAAAAAAAATNQPAERETRPIGLLVEVSPADLSFGRQRELTSSFCRPKKRAQIDSRSARLARRTGLGGRSYKQREAGRPLARSLAARTGAAAQSASERASANRLPMLISGRVQ